LRKPGNWKRATASATGEQICVYADVKGEDYNPFRNLKKQLTANVSVPRPALTDLVDVATLFRTIAAPFERARFDDLVGHAVRFLALTVVRPGEDLEVVGDLEQDVPHQDAIHPPDVLEVVRPQAPEPQ
jgi:hypothetical protein